MAMGRMAVVSLSSTWDRIEGALCGQKAKVKEKEAKGGLANITFIGCWESGPQLCGGTEGPGLALFPHICVYQHNPEWRRDVVLHPIGRVDQGDRLRWCVLA